MVEIISKRDGPRREDVQVKRLIEQNRSTITRIADQISGGGYSASKTPRQAPKPQGLIIHDLGTARPAEEPHPVVRITNNETGHVFYSRTHDHSSMAVAFGGLVSTHFDVPADQERGISDLRVVANGIPSPAVTVRVQ